jgi:hypothetical protein
MIKKTDITHNKHKTNIKQAQTKQLNKKIHTTKETEKLTQT